MAITLGDSRWRALNREGALASRLVGAGLTALRRANAQIEGTYYEAFFGLTIGLERICKLVIVIDDYLSTGRFPTDAQMKHRYGHDLSKLTGEASLRVATVGVPPEWPLTRSTETHEVIDFLTRFARTNRYYNLSALSASDETPEPIEEWVQLVLRHYPQRALTPREVRDRDGMRGLDAAISSGVLIDHSDEAGIAIRSFEDMAEYGFRAAHVQLEGTLMCARIARSLASVLASFDYASSQQETLPVLREHFTLLLVKDSALRRKRRFEFPA